MTLREAVDRYVAWQRDHGTKFRSSAETLDTFCRRIGEDRDCDTVGEDEVRRFLAGNGALTRTRAVKYGRFIPLGPVAQDAEMRQDQFFVVIECQESVRSGRPRNWFRAYPVSADSHYI